MHTIQQLIDDTFINSLVFRNKKLRLNSISTTIKDLNNKVNNYNKEQQEALKTRVIQAKNSKSKLLDLLINNNISQQDFDFKNNELDKELEKRGLRYVRYADDCVIAVGSSASANRVMHTITKWIEQKLGLKVNATKTHVCRPSKLKYLGFGLYKDSQTRKWTARPHETSIEKFKRKLKHLTKRSWSISMADYQESF